MAPTQRQLARERHAADPGVQASQIGLINEGYIPIGAVSDTCSGILAGYEVASIGQPGLELVRVKTLVSAYMQEAWIRYGESPDSAFNAGTLVRTRRVRTDGIVVGLLIADGIKWTTRAGPGRDWVTAKRGPKIIIPPVGFRFELGSRTTPDVLTA